MLIQTKLIGTNLQTSSVFKDFEGAEISPVVVTLKYKTPAGTIIVNTISPVLGKFTTTVSLNAAGKWNFRWECSGDYASAEEFEIEVIQSKVI